MQENLLFNEGYELKEYANRSFGSYIYIKNKKYIDLSSCAGSQILGHNNKILQRAYKDILKKKISNYAVPNIYAVEFSKTLKKVLKIFSKFILCNSGSEAAPARREPAPTPGPASSRRRAPPAAHSRRP